MRLLLLALLLPASSLADIVRIDDGSLIRGTVSAVTDGKLVVKTTFGGSIRIEPKRIASVETDDDRLVELTGGERLTGRLILGPGGDQLVASRQRGKVPAPPVALAAIYPKGTDPDRARWSGTASVGTAGASGNAENRSAQLRTDALRQAPGHRLSAFFQQRFAEQNARQTENETLLGGRYERNLGDDAFVFAGGSLETDEFENLDLRLIASAGYGHRMWDRSDSAFDVRVGAGIQRQEFTDGQTMDNALLDLAYNFRRRILDRVELRHSLNLQPQLDEPAENFRVTADFNADLPVGGNSDWRVRLGLRTDYNSMPQENVEELDTTYTVNLVYRY